MSLGRSSFSCWNWQKFNTQKQRVKILTRYLLLVIGYWLLVIGCLVKLTEKSGFSRKIAILVTVSGSIPSFVSLCA